MSFNFDSKILEKMTRLDSTDTSASLKSQGAKSKLVPGTHVSFSEDDVKKLQKKREKDGWCIACGEVKTHKKVLMRMVPRTVHGLVCIGVCLRCNPSPNLEGYRLSYGTLRLGWERTIRATDFKFRWELSGSSSNSLNTPYVRKVEFFSEDSSDGPLVGQVSLIPAEYSVLDSVVECMDGRTISSFGDIEKAQKMDFKSKKQWFHNASARLCGEHEGHVLINVRQNHMLEDSIKAVLSFKQADLRKKWVFVKEKELDELSPTNWYASVIEKICSSDAGFFVSAAKDELRMDIKFHSDTVCHSMPCALKRTVSKYVSDNFRFLGRVMGKALLDGQLVKCRLAKHIYMLILGWPLMLDDLRDLDVQYYCHIRSLMRTYLLPKYNSHRVARTANAGVPSLGLNFTVSEVNMSGLREWVPLVPNGHLISVDNENLLEYIDSCFKYRMFGRHEVQLSSLLLGFFEVVPEPLLTIFDNQELESLLCGSYMSGKTEDGEVDASFSEHEISTTSEGASGQVSMRNGHPVEAIVKIAPRRVESNSSQHLPEALLIEDALYDAVAEPMETADNSGALDANEIRYRLKKGRCAKCGMQTHKLTGVLKKKCRPISNDNVLNGRCLICNPIKANIWENTERTIDFPLPPPSAPSFEMSPGLSTPRIGSGLGEFESEQQREDAESDNVSKWLLSHLPSLQMQDVENYRECLTKDGFDSIAMMEHLEDEDLAFMKKAHRRALMKSL